MKRLSGQKIRVHREYHIRRAKIVLRKECLRSRSQRLGAMRLFLLPDQTWHRWDRERLARTGGTLEQYKHPCLIVDPKFRDSVPVEQEVQLQVS